MSCASCYNNNKNRKLADFCTRQIKRNKMRTAKIANFLYFYSGRGEQKNLRLGALSMNETRVFITHFSAVVAAVRVENCRVCRNPKKIKKNKGRKLSTNWFACRRKLIRKRNENVTKFPNCWCGVKTLLYFCHIIEIEWFGSFLHRYGTAAMRANEPRLMDLANAAAKMTADSRLESESEELDWQI